MIPLQWERWGFLLMAGLIFRSQETPHAHMFWGKKLEHKFLPVSGTESFCIHWKVNRWHTGVIVVTAHECIFSFIYSCAALWCSANISCCTETFGCQTSCFFPVWSAHRKHGLDSHEKCICSMKPWWFLHFFQQRITFKYCMETRWTVSWGAAGATVQH